MILQKGTKMIYLPTSDVFVVAHVLVVRRLGNKYNMFKRDMYGYKVDYGAIKALRVGDIAYGLKCTSGGRHRLVSAARILEDGIHPQDSASETGWVFLA